MSEMLIPGPAGDLEVRLEFLNEPDSAGEGRPAPLAVICHPHPVYGGTMTNKVVHILAAGFRDLGAHTVRFNFRGVGRSAGEFDNGIGETDDLLAVVKWAQARFPDAPLWLAGFSFGAWIALKATAQLHPERLVLVAPPVDMYDFSPIPEVNVPWIVIQGSKDEVVSAKAVAKWVAQRQPAPQFKVLDSAGHFFHGQLNALKNILKSSFQPG
ncbi:Hydrolase SMc00528, alpha/beta fold family [hydrothermal vent metagenome]|uniref:Hydrolase SMc00528, alpha/beta fold family n=1 Tax=hydrothermal vent metagenome TaxID=652676 RepID=A0A3B1BLQ8_9ZZZZ